MILRHNYHHLILLMVLFTCLTGCTSIRPSRTDLALQEESPPHTFSYASYAKLLQNHVDERGYVDYRKLTANPALLDEFYANLASFSPDSTPQFFPTTEDRLAYWINGYNATVLKGVVHYYPIDSVEDVEEPLLLWFFPSKSGFFFFQRFTYGGHETSLYYLENSVIRGRFTDPRIHFALNCASRSCPRLPRSPFYPEKLHDQLENETRKFINDPSRVNYDPDSNTLFLSAIFEWYRSDFTDWLKTNYPEKPPTLLSYALLYLKENTVKQITQNGAAPQVEFLEYDWGLNDQSMQ